MASSSFTIRQLFEMDACTNCRLCADVCPAACAAANGELSAVYRLKGLKRNLQARAGRLQKLMGRKPLSDADLNHYAETVFRCTLCSNCEEVCPLGIRLKELWLSLREDLVQESAYPSKIDMIRANLAKSRNVFGEDNAERGEWVEDMRKPPEDLYVRPRAEVVYITGCVSAYFPLAQKIPIALAEVMAASGVDFTLLGQAEWCCGFPLLGAGLMEMFEEFRAQNLAAVNAKGARSVVFACPSCYQMWREYYRAGLELLSAPEFLLRLVREGRTPLQDLPLTVAYHDPCDLGRGARVFDEPRELLRAIPGVRLVELPHSRERCTCCGGGGNLEMVDPDLAAKIAKAKIGEVLATGAQAVATSCQQCVRTMTSHVKRNKIALEVLDIVQLVRRALAPSSSQASR
ncbi:MAG: (Fe-S)-binding protein [Desulfobacterales bacterium]|jgi:heterodisulfide reductase subunit D|nr:(Fe-S)-binding protein [Desulfobacterales bacterium]